MIRLRTVLILGLALSLSGCRKPPFQPESPGPEGRPALVLPSPRKQPLYVIATNDPDEIALLQQQLKLTNVSAAPGLIYFEANAAQLGRLRDLGYDVTQADPEAIRYRIARVRRRSSEEELRGQGITVIQRERGYWVISGSLAQLRRLAAAGYRLEQIASDEPRPRVIRIDVGSQLDVQRVANLQVDIFGVADSAGRFIIRGAALDMQIDRLRAAGFTVTILP